MPLVPLVAARRKPSGGFVAARRKPSGMSHLTPKKTVRLARSVTKWDCGSRRYESEVHACEPVSMKAKERSVDVD